MGRRAVRRGGTPPVGGQELDSAHYDSTFENHPHWKEPYSASRYYPLWAVVADRLVRRGSTGVLDIGCGPGQFASHLADRGIATYLGIDFSPARVRQAESLSLPSGYSFTVEDVFEGATVETAPYDSVTCTEFFEHVERDLDVIDRIRPGATVIGTVPNFGGPGHVRCFKDAESVGHRYAAVLADLSVTPIRGKGTHVYFILEGTSLQGGC